MIQYSGTVTIDGHAIDLPAGYKAYFLRIKGNDWDMSKPQAITDRRGWDCKFKVINGVPCLISVRGVVEAKQAREVVV